LSFYLFLLEKNGRFLNKRMLFNSWLLSNRTFTRNHFNV